MIPRYARPAMTALWTDEARLQRLLQVELAHLRALEHLQLAPAGGADTIEAHARIDPARVAEIEKTTKHDVIAFLTSIEEQVGEPGRHLHRGLTSSDALDTALALQLRDATDVLLAGLVELAHALADRAGEHRRTWTIGRSHGMYAEPTTFGLVLAGHLAEIVRGHGRLLTARAEIAVGTLSGAVGTYAQTPPEAEAMALQALGLQRELVPTQVVPRDRHAAYFGTLALIASGIERLATNLRLLQRSEVAEVQEAFSPGQKGSSAMPHKKNPILGENLTGLARMVRGYAHMAEQDVVLWHERDISHSSVERVVAPDATVLVDFMIHRSISLVRGLQVNTARMRAHLDEAIAACLSGNVLLALVDAGMARQAAYAVVQRSALQAVQPFDAHQDSREARPDATLLRALVGQDPEVRSRLDDATLDRCFDLAHHLRHADAILDRALAEARAL